MSLSQQQQRYLHALGITIWLSREQTRGNQAQFADAGEAAALSAAGPAPGASARDEKDVVAPVAPAVRPAADPDGWAALQDKVANCRLCELHATRKQTVFGVGDVNADLMLIGEAPGAEEDRRGEPFVGRAGKLLDAMLHALDLSRAQVYIANILKCRPPNNRDPKLEEVASCEDYLRQQVSTVQPRLILALGRVAAQNLLKTDIPIGKMRGKRYEYGAPPIPVVVTYHPAYLLRAPREKRKSWQDLQLAMQIYREQP